MRADTRFRGLEDAVSFAASGPRALGLGCRVLGFRVLDLGFWGLGFRGLGFRVLGFRV